MLLPLAGEEGHDSVRSEIQWLYPIQRADFGSLRLVGWLEFEKERKREVRIREILK